MNVQEFKGEKERWALKIEGNEIPSLTTFGYIRWMFKNGPQKLDVQEWALKIEGNEIPSLTTFGYILYPLEILGLELAEISDF